VGEAPGREEDLAGEPFVGEAGQLLTRIIQAINLRREDVYIANVLKCRPPNNRDPKPEEVATCFPFLQKQLRAIRPRLICALGKFAAQTLLNTTERISTLRGKIAEFQNIRVVPTFHPASLLRNPQWKRDVWKDMQLVQKLLEENY
jgi:DNA polymerase